MIELAREYATIFHGIADAALVAIRHMAERGEVSASKLDEIRQLADRARHLATYFDDWAKRVEGVRLS